MNLLLVQARVSSAFELSDMIKLCSIFNLLYHCKPKYNLDILKLALELSVKEKSCRKSNL